MKYRLKVTSGKGYGRKIGFPTVNMKIPEGFDLKEGVYQVKVNYKENTYKGVLFFGVRGDELSLEVHILDFLGDFLGDFMDFEIERFIRDVEKFDSEGELILAIERDVEYVSVNNE